MTDAIKVLYYDDDIVLIDKQAGIHSAPLTVNENNTALFYTAQLFPNILQVKNSKKEIEYGLLHRIDTETQGILLFARNQTSYDILINDQKNNQIKKYYTALCMKNSNKLDGFPECPFNLESNITLTSYFRHYGINQKESRPVINGICSRAEKKKISNKLYSTKIESVNRTSSNIKIVCSITNGFKHQVRCHLAWLSYPVIGDTIYNSIDKDKENITMLFYANKIEFLHPTTREIINFSSTF